MGTILGRPSSSVLAVLTTILNVLIVFHVGGFTPTIEQTGTLNAALSAVVAFVSNANVSTALATPAPKV